jgi:hypothetical protein
MSRPLNRLAFALLLPALVAGAAGCSAAKPAVATRTVLELNDLGVTAAMPEPNTFAIVEAQPSIGRFPAGVSVARVKLEIPQADSPPVLLIDTLTDPEALYWNELFDSVGKIREVTVIDPQSVPQRYVTIPQLLASSRRQKCRLCVIYGQNDLAADVSRAIGALYDADTSELIGVIFAEQIVNPKEERSRPPDYPEGDERYMDAHWLTTRKFESLTREFVLDLINRDREPGASAETTTQPTATAPAALQAAPGAR